MRRVNMERSLIIIIYHDFVPPSRGVVMSSQITLTQSSNTHPLGHSPYTMQVSATKNGHIKLDHLHMHQGSPPLPIFCVLWHSLYRHPSFPMLPQAIFMPSIQPNLAVLCTHPPLPSAINILPVIRYPSILSMCPNHLNTL